MTRESRWDRPRRALALVVDTCGYTPDPRELETRAEQGPAQVWAQYRHGLAILVMDAA